MKLNNTQCSSPINSINNRLLYPCAVKYMYTDARNGGGGNFTSTFVHFGSNIPYTRLRIP